MRESIQTKRERATQNTLRLRRLYGATTLVAVQLLLRSQSSVAFCSQSGFRPSSLSPLFATDNNPDDEITRQLARAKEVLAMSKAKLEAKQSLAFDDDAEGQAGAKVPFFATAAPKNAGDKKERVIKSKNGDGLFTTDGDLMAKLSEAEEWEVRSLLDVFENENKNPHDSLADRDVAASIFGLQRVLQTEDFQRIFDKRNRFIGEQ